MNSDKPKCPECFHRGDQRKLAESLGLKPGDSVRLLQHPDEGVSWDVRVVRISDAGIHGNWRVFGWADYRIVGVIGREVTQ